jgi:site-specific DNA-cytosine methylase
MWILPKQLHTSDFVQDMEGLNLDSRESIQLCARSLCVKSRHLPSQIWFQRWNLDSWIQYLSGRILRPSHGKSFQERWISSLPGIPVSHFQTQEIERENTTSVTYGRTLQTEFLFSGQQPASLKTSKDMFRLDSPQLLATWNSLVTEQRGHYFQRLNAARLKLDGGSLSWPSPVASEAKQGYQDRSKGKKGKQESLTTLVMNHGLPAHLSRNMHGNPQELWSTPRANKVHPTITEENREQLATRNKSNLEEQMAGHCGRAMGTLNPRWVEALMGLPTGMVMPSCTHPIALNVSAAESQSAQTATITTPNVLAKGQIAAMIDNRDSELRLLGNGVVPQVSAKAFYTLLNTLNKQHETQH